MMVVFVPCLEAPVRTTELKICRGLESSLLYLLCNDSSHVKRGSR